MSDVLTPVHCPLCGRQISAWAPLTSQTAFRWRQTCPRCRQPITVELRAAPGVSRVRVSG